MGGGGGDRRESDVKKTSPSVRSPRASFPKTVSRPAFGLGSECPFGFSRNVSNRFFTRARTATAIPREIFAGESDFSQTSDCTPSATTVFARSESRRTKIENFPGGASHSVARDSEFYYFSPVTSRYVSRRRSPCSDRINTYTTRTAHCSKRGVFGGGVSNRTHHLIRVRQPMAHAPRREEEEYSGSNRSTDKKKIL